MRRVFAAVVVTVAALVLLANFHTASGAKHAFVVAPLPSKTPAAGGPPGSGDGLGGGSGGGEVPTTEAPVHGTREINGLAIPTQFGTVQVRVTLVNGRITDVEPLQMPFERQRSQEISRFAAPALHDEALGAQSAQIELISGATYTSDAYRESLQVALAQAAS